MSELILLKIPLYAVGVILLGAILIVVSWSGISTGQLFIRILKNDRSEPHRFSIMQASWILFGIFLLNALFPDFGGKRSYTENFFWKPVVWLGPVAVIIGVVLYLLGVKSCTWKTAALAALPMAGWAWLGITSQHDLLNGITLTLYAASCVVVLFLYFKMFHAMRRVRDEIVTDWNSPSISPALLNTFNLLTPDSEPMAESPTYSRYQLMRGRIVNAAELEAIAESDGLMLRFEVERTEKYIYFDDPTRAVWFLVPWQNLDVVKYDHIIGYTELRLRLRNSANELVLEFPSKRMRKFLPAMNDRTSSKETTLATSS